MNKEIQERITAVCHGKVPKGYKKSECGILPNTWDEVNLSEISTHVTKKNIDNAISVTLTNSATKGVIKQTEYFEKTISNYKNTDGYYIVEKNDFIYNPRISVYAPCGPINQSHFDETGIVSPLYTVFKMNKENQEDKYIEYYFKSSSWHRYMKSVANYGVRYDRMNITNDDFFRMPIPKPPFTEKEKIAEILEHCDKVIEKYETKVNEYKNLKKVCLSKMFPKKGNCVPEIRFPGFEEDWEQRKLWETLYSLQNNTLSRAELSLENGVAKNVHYGDILVKFGEVLDVEKEFLPMIMDESVVAKYRSSFLQNGDIVITDTAEDETVGKCSEIAGLSDEKVIAGLHTIPCRPLFNFASGYLGYYLNSDAYHKQLLPLMQGIKVTSISKSALQDTEIQYPGSLEEQEQIGTFFRHLDHLITLHQSEVEEYTQIKKVLARLLLTGIVRVKV